jgi:hypothetical protein
MKHMEYREGPQAKESFQQAMKALFQAVKPKKPKQRGKSTTLKKKPKSDKG